jgi:hypothetical protein
MTQGIIAAKDQSSIATYREIIERLNALEVWLKNLGIATSPTRLGLYQRKLLALAEAHEAGAVDRLYSKADAREMILTFSEISEFEFIQEHLQSISDNCGLAEKLKEVISGPNLTRDEDPASSSNRPRNVLFELTVSASLAAAGLALLPAGTCDVAASFEAHTVLIECKRPQFEHQLNSAIKGGMNQLKTRMASVHGANFGILAISVSKALLQGRKLVTANTQQGVSVGIDSVVDAFIRAHKRTWNAKAPPGVIAVMIHFRASGVSRNDDQLHVGQKYFICPLEHLDPGQLELAKRFYEKFSSGTLG